LLEKVWQSKCYQHRTNKLYHIPVKIHSAIAQNDQYPHLVNVLYLFVRSFDVSGTGIVEFDLANLAQTLNRSISTIKTNLRLARRLGVFRVLRISGLSVKAAYISLPKLCLKLGVQKLGAIYELDSNKFHTLRSQTVRFTIAMKQEHSKFVANQSAKDLKQRRTIELGKIFDIASDISIGVTGIKDRVGHFLLVTSEFTPYGTSQKLVGSILNRSTQTIRKHLQAINGLEEVTSLQICQSDQSNSINMLEDRMLWLEHEIGLVNYFCWNNVLYKCLPNIYDLDSSFLFNQKWLRRRVSKMFR
jgi:hypothetical protein